MNLVVQLSTASASLASTTTSTLFPSLPYRTFICITANWQHNQRQQQHPLLLAVCCIPEKKTTQLSNGQMPLVLEYSLFSCEQVSDYENRSLCIRQLLLQACRIAQTKCNSNKCQVGALLFSALLISCSVQLMPEKGKGALCRFPLSLLAFPPLEFTASVDYLLCTLIIANKFKCYSALFLLPTALLFSSIPPNQQQQQQWLGNCTPFLWWLRVPLYSLPKRTFSLPLLLIALSLVAPYFILCTS